MSNLQKNDAEIKAWPVDIASLMRASIDAKATCMTGQYVLAHDLSRSLLSRQDAMRIFDIGYRGAVPCPTDVHMINDVAERILAVEGVRA